MYRGGERGWICEGGKKKKKKQDNKEENRRNEGISTYKNSMERLFCFSNFLSFAPGEAEVNVGVCVCKGGISRIENSEGIENERGCTQRLKIARKCRKL